VEGDPTPDKNVPAFSISRKQHWEKYIHEEPCACFYSFQTMEMQEIGGNLLYKCGFVNG
jgi:hypothetical protein